MFNNNPQKRAVYIRYLLVFSPWVSLGRNKSPVRRPVWLW